MATTPARPIEVAVIGSGCAAITTAFELTRPEHQGRYAVTIYQEGWRCGGKGASGRGPGSRIEEHGLHVWMGFYENAFRLLRECYAELGRDPSSHRFARWDDAFFPDPVTGVIDRRGSSHWLGWFPPGAGTPGDPAEPAQPFSVADYLVRTVQLVEALLLSAARQPGTSPAPTGRSGVPSDPTQFLERIARWLRYGQLATLTGLLEGTMLLQLALRAVARLPLAPLVGVVDAVGRAAQAQLAALVEHDDEMRRLREMIDLVLAVLRGSLRFGLVTHPDGFDAIDDWEWREWLRANGAQQSSVDSAFVLSLYNLPFAYEEGDPSRPRASAAVALRCSLRAFLTYRGSFFWKMRTGMGDAVFAPYYLLLKRRGVRFRFFHRLANVRLAPAERSAPGAPGWVEALEIDVQAETRTGAEYRPLIDVGGVECWPSAPDWSQLREGERMEREGRDFECFWERSAVGRRTLRVGHDFDFVVLGVGLGAIPHVAAEIVAREPRWARMVQEVQTTATQAFQLWLREPASALGWSDGPINVTGIDGGFETWADMSHLAPEERLPGPTGSIAYFCASLPTPRGFADATDTSRPAAERKRVRDAAIHFLDHQIGAVWPRAVESGGFRWDLLVSPPGHPNARAAGPERFETQFWTANVSPSSRYVLSLPGTARYRISPLDRSLDNLTVAGDWTACGLDASCVEAATISGRLAAHAIAGRPALEDIAGFDHP